MSKNPVFTPAGMIATVFGLGKIVKVAPGTAGSFVGAVAAIFLPLPVRLGVIVALSAIGVWAAGAYEKMTGRTDPGEVIIDEVAGQLLATVGHIAGAGFHDETARYFIACFILFRFFDILKPWPVSACEKAPGGLGIMLDDLVGGFLAGLLLLILRKVFIEGWWPF